MTQTTITEAEAERILDRRVQQRLRTDSAYLNAEDAEAQAAREDEISEQEWNALKNRIKD